LYLAAKLKLYFSEKLYDPGRVLMKRKIIAAVFTGMLTVALFPAIAHAEIENPEDYMGIWYANYVIYSDESSERHNVAEYLNQYLEMRLMEDGSAYMEMSYNSEEPD
jgi:hypothetical protein